MKESVAVSASVSEAAGAAAEGTGLSWESVFRAHAADVERWAARLGGPRVDTDDVVQEVFVAVQRQLPKYQPHRAKLPTWLYGITANVVRHQRRKLWWRGFLGGSSSDVAGELSDPAEGPGARLEHLDDARRMYAALDALNERYRTVLILFEMEELSGEEIALRMGTKVSTVWVWLHRARAALKERLAQP
jgi:RNA polymerase sigma-70 factor (ECF subfamily)